MESKPIAVAGRVIVDSTEAVIPDLDRLGHLTAHAAFGALPLTS
jgi:chemosensory pili system protein ChpC